MGVTDRITRAGKHPVTGEPTKTEALARIKGTTVPVWKVIALVKVGLSAHTITQVYPDITECDVSAARVYYQEHRESVERDFREVNARSWGGAFGFGEEDA